MTIYGATDGCVVQALHSFGVFCVIEDDLRLLSPISQLPNRLAR